MTATLHRRYGRTRQGVLLLCALVALTVGPAWAQASKDTARKADRTVDVLTPPAERRGMFDWLIFWRDDRPKADSTPPTRLSDRTSRRSAPKPKPKDKAVANARPATLPVRLPDPLRELPPPNPLARTVAEQVDTSFGARLSGPYPNPASVEVRIDYATGAAPGATLRLYDFLGKPVRELSLRRGVGYVTLEVSSLSPGLYFYSLEVERKVVATRRMVISR